MAFNTITGLRTYRIPPSEANKLRRKAVRRNVIAAAVSFIVPIVANEWRRSHKLPDLPSDISEVLLFTVFFVPWAALLVWVIWRNVKKARASVDRLLSIEIIVDEASVSRRQPGVADISLPFAQITRIEEYRHWFTICSRSARCAVMVPQRVERVEELKMLIRSSSSAEWISRKNLWNWEMLCVLGLVASMVTLGFASTAFYVKGAALCVVALMLIGAIQVFRNPYLQAKQRGQIVVGFTLVLAFVVIRVISVWPF
jgi:cation transport ATPase